MGLGALADAVDQLELSPCAGDLIDGFVLLDRLTARLVSTVGAFDRAGLWALDGASSMTGWLKANAVRTDGDAASLTKIARLLHALPVTAGAFDEGRLSYGQVQTIAANVNARTVERFAEHEADMVPSFETLTIKKTADAMQYWARHAAALADDPEPSDPMNTVHHSKLLNGTSRLDAELDAEATAKVALALELAETPWNEGEPVRTAGERRSDALVDIFEFFLSNHQRTTGTHNVPHIHLNMSMDDLRNHTGASTIGGAGLPHHQVRRLCCDATISRVVMNGTEIIDFGRSERLAPKALFAVLALNDRTCRYPGCDRKPSWCHAHHVHHWEDGGETKFENLTLLCSRHHRLIHKPGWALVMLPGRIIQVTTPDGAVLTSHPPNRHGPEPCHKAAA
jgi:Domain of unknown function (DUF222)/HNH endonuclease